MAPLTAPHSLWPSTTISFAPASLVANSALPTTSAAATLPAMRALKMSPMRWSNTSSGGTRESMQPMTTAKGYCPPAVALT
jgi:hypothetical protein